ncbi:MAG: 4Fe-4S dicluster domain-containing protein, partial [Candidatus Eremiobacteraeota bacterium]|nr:4Fe-4S dicluster domain-containing protein [Candidatus Eremiobacteraeota bacterium]
LLDLYDPTRRFGTTDLGRLAGLVARARVSEGQGLAILSRPLRSPLLEAQRQRLKRAMPQARWFVHDPAPATTRGFDRPYLPHYDLEQARLIVSFDEDFLGVHPDRLRLAGQFAERRQPGPDMSRLYVLESCPSPTGQVADHCRRLHPAAIEQALWALARVAGVHDQDGQDSPLVRAMVDELKDHQGRCVLMAGPWLSPQAQVLVHRLNRKFGGLVSYTAEPEEAGLEQLQESLADGQVRWLLILGGDPVMESGGEFDLDELELSLHLSEFPNQTSQACGLAMPRAHRLESWGDQRFYDGRVGFVQPLVEPLYGGISDHELLALLVGERLSPLEALRRHYGSRLDLAKGWLSQDQPTAEPVEAVRPTTPAEEEPLLLFRPDPNLVDGSLAHNAWLQELPRPLTALCWGQPALVSTELEEGQHLALATQRGQLEVPHYRLDQHPANCATLYLGPEAYRLRRELWQAPVKMQPGQGYTEVVTTQHHHVIEHELFGEQPTESLYPEPAPGQVAWGMVIDLNRCIGCNACVVACQSENNIPVVGAEEVHRGREMYWIRIDSYFKPREVFMPVPCMHCEHAPCEQVCPVEATLHSHDGLNEMIYNR